MSLNLREGATIALEITRTPRGYLLAVTKGVGDHRRKLAAKRVATEEEALVALARWVDGRLAKIGLAKTKAVGMPRDPEA